MSFQEKESTVVRLAPRLLVWVWPNRDEVLPPGEWIDENVDKVQAECPHTGYMLIAARHPELGIWNGYVVIPRGHVLFGKDYDEPEISGLSVHGGTTYSGPPFLALEPPIPIDAVHRLVLDWDTLIPLPREDYWLFGFDCAHCSDIVPGFCKFGVGTPAPGYEKVYRRIEYVIEECQELAKQLYEADRQATIASTVAGLITYKQNEEQCHQTVPQIPIYQEMTGTSSMEPIKLITFLQI